MPNFDMSMLAPSGGGMQGMPQPGGMPQGAPQGGGAPAGGNPGAIEALKAGIQYLMQQGLSVEQIIEAMLKFIEMNPNMNIPEEQVRQIVEQTAQQLGGAQGAAPMGAAEAGMTGPQQ
jgi:hypothetical protein